MRGARSILGSLPAYARAALVAAAIVALAGAIWFLRRPAETSVVLPAGGGWSSATLDGGGAIVVVEAGAPVAVPPGLYRVTFEADDGRVATGVVDVDGPLSELAAPAR